MERTGIEPVTSGLQSRAREYPVRFFVSATVYASQLHLG